jgi:CheY-like chemotaxis protein
LLRLFFNLAVQIVDGVCIEAEDGLSAIRMADNCELVVLDLNMPNMNGVETASILRRTLPQVKIVGFSALVRDAETRDELLATKTFDAVLSKLDGLDRLVEAVKALVPEPAKD